MNHLEEALDLAARGWGATSPNPAVGAVVVRDGEVVGRGFHTWSGLKHAEVLALEEARERARGATLYVSLEPCAHHGRTPPCIDAILAAGVRKVVAPMEDPNPQTNGRGFTRLRDAGVEVELVPEFAERAIEINEAFLHFMKTGRPLVTLKAAVTLDGKIGAPEDGASPRVDHQRNCSCACADPAASVGCDCYGHRDSSRGRLQVDGSIRAGTSVHFCGSCWIRNCGCLRNRGWRCRVRTT